MAGGVPAILLPIVADFKTSGLGSIARLETALAERRYPDAKDILHQLKGASGTMGLRQFQELCAECESHVLADTAPPRLAEFRPLLDQSVQAACRDLQDH
jgi:HPt (histidine-containing phosphotransfer) domain-containing protein